GPCCASRHMVPGDRDDEASGRADSPFYTGGKHMSKFLIATGIFAAFALAGCENMSTQDKGTLGGAVVGGAVGSAATGGSTVGTIGGAAAGGIIGHELGERYEERNRR